MCKDLNIPCKEADLSLTEIYTADEVFCTGTMGELTPVVEVDGRDTRSKDYTILKQLNARFLEVRARYCTSLDQLINS
jgi:branched-chain amino acid aminotransferase